MANIFRPDSPADLYLDGYSAYIFDWDGTLANSHQANYASMRDALSGHGISMSWDWFNDRTGVSSEEMAEEIAGVAGVPLDSYLVARSRDENYLRLLDQVHRIDAVVDVLLSLRRKEVPVALATGGAGKTVLRTVELLGLSEEFDVIVTREDAVHGKPHPEIFLTAASRLGVDPSACLVYEDSDQGVEAAERAGMDVVDVRVVQGRD